MNYKKSFERLGFVEGVDFEINGQGYNLLSKYDENSVEYFIQVTEEQLQVAWEEVQISEYDLVAVLDYFLSDKQELVDHEHDSFNVSNGVIFRWDFKNIQKPTNAEILALAPAAQDVIDDKLEAYRLKTIGKKDREMCDAAREIIGGFNRDRHLNDEQITAMQSTFGPILNLLIALRPTKAKYAIQQITPDGTLITDKMKRLVLNELREA